jgi:anti-anti-sigma factor
MRVPSGPLHVRVEDADSVVRLRLTGRFDGSSRARLDRAIGKAEQRDVVLDLGRVSFMDSAAWLAIMGWEQRVRDWGKDLSLVNVQGRTRMIFELTQTEHLLSEVRAGG